MLMYIYVHRKVLRDVAERAVQSMNLSVIKLYSELISVLFLISEPSTHFFTNNK